MTRKNIIVYLRKGTIPCGSDYTIITELKTIKGINRRYKEHDKRMLKAGCSHKCIISYYTWCKMDYDELEKYANHHKTPLAIGG